MFVYHWPAINQWLSQVISEKRLFMPVSVVQQWRNHSLVGAEFQKVLDEFLKDYEIVEPKTETTEPNDKDPKRPAPTPLPSPSKKPRNALDASLICEANSITQAMLTECRIGSRDPPVFLQVRASNHIYLVNKGSKEFTANELHIAGFGRGSFRIVKNDADLPDGAIELSFSGHTDVIHFNGSLTTVGEVLKELRNRNPDCKVCYFKLKFAEDGNPHAFELIRTHRVVFVPRPEEKTSEMKEMNAAAREPLQVWNASQAANIFWVMKFSSVKGLIPVKPAVYLKGHCSVGPGQALVISKP